MARGTRFLRPKTAADLNDWLTGVVSPRLFRRIEVVAHGGTALSLRGLKATTKDVDLAVRAKPEFDAFCKALEKGGYHRIADFAASPRERLVRFNNPREVVDRVDLRWPTWNNWVYTTEILSTALTVDHGRVTLALPSPEVIFLFKTYPLRETDIADLETVAASPSLDQQRVTTLFDDQDRILRSRMSDPSVPTEPLIDILQIRTRFAGALSLMHPSSRRLVKKIRSHSIQRFDELDLGETLPSLIARLRDPNALMSWESVLEGQGDRLRQLLTLQPPATKPRSRSGTASTGRERPRS